MQYNQRVNITYTVAESAAGVISIPLRGESSDLTYWDGLAFRPSASDDFLMRPMGDKVFTGFDSIVRRHGSTILKGYYHVFSYQVVDVMNEDGTLKEIRVYAWADGKQMFNGEYYTISTDHQFWIEKLAEPATLISSPNDGFDIVSITFGDELSQEYVTTIPEQVIIPYGETYEYQLKTAIKGAQIESITYIDSKGVSSATQPTKVGSYTVEIVASAPNYTNVTITGGEIKQNVYGGGNKAAVSGTTNVVIGK
jgi:hypothetical protein